ncbi:MAG: type II toxin-antitoxin system prevent-host-death family antitoxin [Nitrospinae bacterium]|nr:type II toxin-antitoxin system prevent-host-death family antitoxin [Nitrospinota bacterium]
MKTFGAYEAKTHLNQLLDLVEKGERITITRHGTPVATMQPADKTRKKSADAVAQMAEFGKGRRLDGLTIRKMINEGRK